MIDLRSALRGANHSGKDCVQYGMRHGNRLCWPILLILGGILASCGNNGEPIVLDESGLPWTASNGYCQRESEEGPMMRVINRADPELCGRIMKIRPAEYVRIQRIPIDERD